MRKKQNVKIMLELIVFTVLFIYFLINIGTVAGLVKKLITLIFPFLLGCAIAFVINIPMSSIEKKMYKNKEGKLYRGRRVISMLVSYLFVVVIIALVVFVVVPEVGRTINNINDKFPVFQENVKNFLNKYTDKYPELEKAIDEFEIDWQKVSGILFDNSRNIVETAVGIFSSIVSAVANTLIGIIFSIYILAQKETLGRQTKMFIYSIFKESVADEILTFCKIASVTTSKFLTCQFREGIILGSMFVVAMLILKFPFAITIGVLIAFTALIPIFGAFIGLFIGAFLILVDTPAKAIWFVVLFFVLQAIENYLIYPRLVGGGVGLSPIWVLLAVIVGGDLMGVVGMFLFIPIVSVAYAYTRSLMYRRLDKIDIDVDDKVVPDSVVPLMEEKHRLFSRKHQEAERAAEE